jgi:CheY-like chemotaxis protein
MSKKILIVEDEEDPRAFLAAILKKEGYELSTAADGAEALEAVKREKPDLVILDLLMPHKTGTDFYRRLSKDEELRDTPIIVVSALAGRHLAVKYAVAVFDKPVDPGEFAKAVREALT